MPNVRLWHKADITIVLKHVRFWGKADMMIQAAHPRLGAADRGEFGNLLELLRRGLVQYFSALLVADGVYRFDQFNQIDQARRAASVCQYRANRDYQA